MEETDQELKDLLHDPNLPGAPGAPVRSRRFSAGKRQSSPVVRAVRRDLRTKSPRAVGDPCTARSQVSENTVDAPIFSRLDVLADDAAAYWTWDYVEKGTF